MVIGIAMMYDSLNASVSFLKTTGIVTSYVSTGEGSGIIRSDLLIKELVNRL